MDMVHYQMLAGSTAIYPERGKQSERALNYCLVGLAGEVGETLNKWKKVLRGDKPLDKVAMMQELGGVYWYLSQSAAELGTTLADIAQMNLDELAQRNVRGTLRGDGDNR